MCVVIGVLYFQTIVSLFLFDFFIHFFLTCVHLICIFSFLFFLFTQCAPYCFSMGVYIRMGKFVLQYYTGNIYIFGDLILKKNTLSLMLLYIPTIQDFIHHTYLLASNDFNLFPYSSDINTRFYIP